MKINKADRAFRGWPGHLAFQWKRSGGHRLRYLWNRVRWHIYPRLGRAGSFPDHVDIELSSACNMKCPMCYTTTSAFKEQVPHTRMDFALYTRIVDELSAGGTFSVRLSWRGEPTLNDRFVDCVRYAKDRGVREVSSLTNALTLTPAMFEKLVELEMDWLTISFDGLGATYERIRAPACFEPMVEKLRAYAAIRNAKGSRKPALRIQGVWPAVQEDAEAYVGLFEGLADEVSVNNLLDYLHKDRDAPLIENFTCPVPFQRLVVGSDGRVFMCVNDELGRVAVGDARRQSIREIWNSESMNEVRAAHREHRGTAAYAPCKDCYQPRKTHRAAYPVGQRTLQLEELVGRPQTIGA